MGVSAFLFAYLLGGITFLPLLVIAVLLHAHLTFPTVPDDGGDGARGAKSSDVDADDIVQPGDDVSALNVARKLEASRRATMAATAPTTATDGDENNVKQQQQQQHREPDIASGYFAVCREYTPMGINAKPIERATPIGPATVAAPSPSVYQTMYRSIFDRAARGAGAGRGGPLGLGPGSGSSSSLDSASGAGGPNQRPKKAGNVFYVVLRHGHLMLFDDDEQLEVRHVISLAHHDVSIYSGGGVTPEGELFIKRNAICLARMAGGLEVAHDSHVSKPFFLFSENCSAKEDFYFALLRNQQQTFGEDRELPIPLGFDVKSIIGLVQKLHASEEHYNTRWLNAMIGRIFLGVYKTKDLENFIREKITKKISRVNRPSFLSSIKLQKMDMGDAAPTITNPRLRDLTVEGECVVEADVRYSGGFRIEVATTASLELGGGRFRTREVNLVLAVVVRRLEGHLVLRVKPPPSNRLWFAFEKMPRLEMAIEPIVSSRQITYTVILRQIENRIKEVVAESVVLPFWDDVPFFRTEHKRWRGGIFAGDDAVEPSSGSPILAPNLPTEANVAQGGDVDEVERMENPAVPGSAPLPGIEKSYSLPLMVERVDKNEQRGGGLFGRRLRRSKSRGTDGSSRVPLSSSSAVSLGLDTSSATPTKSASSRPVSPTVAGSIGTPSPAGWSTARSPAPAALSPAVASPTTAPHDFDPHRRSSVATTPRDTADRSDYQASSASLPGVLGRATADSDGGSSEQDDRRALKRTDETNEPASYSSGSSIEAALRARISSITHASQKNTNEADTHGVRRKGFGAEPVVGYEHDGEDSEAGRGKEHGSGSSGSSRQQTASSTEEHLPINSEGQSTPDSQPTTLPRSFTGSSLRSSILRRENTQSSATAARSITGSQGGEPPKRLATIAAATNAAAASARRWGWNMLQRNGIGRGGDGIEGSGMHVHDGADHQDPSVHPRSTTYDLSQPMGRGMPLPPPGTPLPSPMDLARGAGSGGGRHITPLPPPTLPLNKTTDQVLAKQPQRKPLPPPFLPERQSVQDLRGASGEDSPQQQQQQLDSSTPSASSTWRRPMPPPALPRRSRQLATDGADEDVAAAAGAGFGQFGMLVVAAPVESEPTTPTSTGEAHYRGGIDEDGGNRNLHAHGDDAQRRCDTECSRPSFDATADAVAVEKLPSGKYPTSSAPESSEPTPPEQHVKASPTAPPLPIRASSAAIADDDDLSGWMDDDGDGDGEEEEDDDDDREIEADLDVRLQASMAFHNSDSRGM